MISPTPHHGSLGTALTQHLAGTSDALLQAAAAPAKHYVLQYSYVPDMMSKRDPYRQTHLDTVKKWVRHQYDRSVQRSHVSTRL